MLLSHFKNIWKASLLCGFAQFISLQVACLKRMSSCTWRIWMASLLYGSSHAPSRNLILKNTCHTWCTSMASLLCGLVCLQVTWCWEALVTLCANEWLIYRVDVPSSGQLLRSSWHTLKQLKSLSPVWVHSCFFKLRAWENDFLQLEHWNGLSSVWVPSWVSGLLSRSSWRTSCI